MTVHLRPTDKAYVMPSLPRAQVELRDAFGNPHRLEVEVAATDASEERGLMWRSSVPPGTGMLFIFHEESDHTFWMKNTLVPLDMIFIGGKGRVVGVVAEAAPLSLTQRHVGRPSKYVLEVPGGWAAKNGIQRGCQVTFEGLEMISGVR